MEVIMTMGPAYSISQKYLVASSSTRYRASAPFMSLPMPEKRNITPKNMRIAMSDMDL